MPGATVNISLPSEMREYVQQQVSLGGYSTTSEYLRNLIREDQKRHANERLERLLLDGLESGTSKSLTRGDWDALHATLDQRLAERQQSDEPATTA